MSRVFLVNEKTQRRYEVLNIDRTQDPPRITLKGETATFTEDYDKEHFKKMGYRPETVNDEETEDA
jgi:hypothetical protein